MPLNGVVMLNLIRGHAERVEEMPFHHRDPFDRLLVAQATYENLVLLSADTALDAYEGLRRVW